ncbi:MAG: tRNA pseudouridine(13) synthase TruD [Lysobacterales bacterium]
MSLPRAYGPALGRAGFRRTPADFEVEELLPFAADGDGPQQLLQVRKTGANTAFVAGRLARHAGVPERDVGYSGLKDRHAVATQYFTVPTPLGGVDWTTLQAEGVEVLDAQPHRRKLRRGSHRGNRFAIRVVDVSAPTTAIEDRLARIRQSGFPNYFGEQRFGHGNRQAWQRLLAGDRRMNRNQRGFALSALRADIFNTALAQRVENGTWDQAQAGEPLMLDGRGSWFVPEAIDADIQQRLASGELHPSGPLAGRSKRELTGPAAELEAAVLTRFEGLDALCERLALDADRRALRAMPTEFSAEPLDASDWMLRFVLPRGCFATALLQAVFDLVDLAAVPTITDN